MYSQNVVVAIKCQGKVLRENGDTVTLPFGSEYSILIKNLNSVRSEVTLSVDGQDATEGTRLIIDPNSSLELERFIKGGNLNVGNRFKFIERTGGIEAHRGIAAEDGLIRLEAWKERVKQYIEKPVVVPHYYDEWYPAPRPSPWRPRPWGPYPRPMGAPHMRSSGPQMRGASPLMASTMSMKGPGASAGKRPNVLVKDSAKKREVERGEVGITVPGSESRQQFHSASGFALEPQSIVIVLRLRGEVGGQPVAAPVTVNAKAVCDTCGKSNKANSQFCSACGTSLVVYA